MMEYIEQILNLLRSHTTLDYFLRASLILIIAVISNILIRKAITKFLTDSADNLKAKATSFQFLKNGSTFIILIGALVIIFSSIPPLKNLGVTLLASAGIFAAVIGLAAQQAFSNIISGIFLVIFKPFRVGDVIRIGIDIIGTVEDINLRHSVIRDFENRRIIIPNSIISSETIINSNLVDEKICMHFVMGISYDSDADLAMKIMQEHAENHPLSIDNRTSEEKAKDIPKVRTKIIGYGDSSVNLRAWIWAKNPEDSFNVRWDLNQSIKKAFDQNGIEIPFPHRTLVFKNPIPTENNDRNKA